MFRKWDVISVVSGTGFSGQEGVKKSVQTFLPLFVFSNLYLANRRENRLFHTLDVGLQAWYRELQLP